MLTLARQGTATTCQLCQKYGYTAKFCRSSGKKRGRFNGSFPCGKREHRVEDCFSKTKQNGNNRGGHRKSNNKDDGCYVCDNAGHMARKRPDHGSKGCNKGGQRSGPGSTGELITVETAAGSAASHTSLVTARIGKNRPWTLGPHST